MRSNLFLNNSSDQNVPIGSFVLIQSSCASLPWHPVKKFSSIVGRTCSDIFRANDPATLIEFFLPIEEYLPGHHIPDMSARACEDIKEVVKTEHKATISNQDIVDLAFVLEPGFVDEKTNIVFLGMENAFLCRYEWSEAAHKMRKIADLQSFPPTVMRSNGCPNSIKDAFPKRVFDSIGLIQERCRRVLCRYSERQGNFCHCTEDFNFSQDVWEYLCDRFYRCGVVMRRMPRRTVIRTKTLIGLSTVTMRVTRSFDILSFKTEQELKVLRGVFGTTCSMGLRQRRPKLGEGEKTLKWGDIINVVVPNNNGEGIVRSGVQLNFNGSSIRLTINYEKYIYNVSRTGFVTNLCPCPVLLLTIRHNTPSTVIAAPQEKDADVLQVETEFADENTGHILVIRGVYDDRVEAEIMEPSELTGKKVSYADHAFVAQCVRRYN